MKRQIKLQNGFSLIEMLVVMSIAGILLAVAVPQLYNMKASYNRLNARSYFMQDVKRAQAESITQGCRGIMVIASDAESYSFGCDYLSYDTTTDPTYDKLSFKRNLPSNIKIASTGPIIFNSRGQAIDIDYIISNLTISFTEYTSGGGYSQFSTGTLLGTGVFNFD